MIYEFPDVTAPIRQGDIFEAIPRIDISFSEFSIVNENNEPEAVTWEDIRGVTKPLTAVVELRAVWAIVITQDCDTIRVPDISLCEIRPLSDVLRMNLPNWGIGLTPVAATSCDCPRYPGRRSPHRLPQGTPL